MNNPAWLDASELDESIAKLDAIKPPTKEEADIQWRINYGLYWMEALNEKFGSETITNGYCEDLAVTATKLGMLILKSEYAKGRRYVEPQK
jgi:hypothetical protein